MRESSNDAYSILFLTRELPWRLEIYAEESEFAFVILARILDGVDVERHSKAMDRKDYGLCLAVDKDL